MQKARTSRNAYFKHPARDSEAPSMRKISIKHREGDQGNYGEIIECSKNHVPQQLNTLIRPLGRCKKRSMKPNGEQEKKNR